MNDDHTAADDGPPAPPSDDAVEHLWNAATEFLKAMRALVDAADEFVAEQRHRSGGPQDEPRLRNIDIDVS